MAHFPTILLNHLHRKTGLAYSEFFSSDVPHSILVSPTDNWQALNEAGVPTELLQLARSLVEKILRHLNSIRNPLQI